MNLLFMSGVIIYMIANEMQKRERNTAINNVFKAVIVVVDELDKQGIVNTKAGIVLAEVQTRLNERMNKEQK